MIGDFTVDKTDATKDLPEGTEAVLHKAVVKAVKQRGPFKHVIDKTKDAEPDAADAQAPKKRVILAGTIIAHDKGSRGVRYVTGGMGGGRAKLKVRYTYTDAEGGTVLETTEHEGKFCGWKTFAGRGGGEAAEDAAKDVGGDVVGDLHKLRGWDRR